jgi:hypothetical protein
MDISKALPSSVTIEYQDEDWKQTIDYEHIPFCCRKCHEHGHLFCDFPLNAQNPRAGEKKKKDGYKTITGRKKTTPPEAQSREKPKDPHLQIF